MEHISEALYGMLVAQGLSNGRVGARTGSNKIEGRSQCGAAPQFPAAQPRVTAGGKRSRVRLVWSNPTTMSEAPSREGKPGASLIAVI